MHAALIGSRGVQVQCTLQCSVRFLSPQPVQCSVRNFRLRCVCFFVWPTGGRAGSPLSYFDLPRAEILSRREEPALLPHTSIFSPYLGLFSRVRQPALGPCTKGRDPFLVLCEATIYRLLHTFSTPEMIDFFLLEDPQIVGKLQKLVPKLEIFLGLRPEPRLEHCVPFDPTPSVTEANSVPILPAPARYHLG